MYVDIKEESRILITNTPIKVRKLLNYSSNEVLNKVSHKLNINDVLSKTYLSTILYRLYQNIGVQVVACAILLHSV